MAKPPRIRDFVVEVPEDQEWFRIALPQLRTFIQDTSFALDKQLTRGANMLSQKKELEIQTGATVADSFPLAFNCTLGFPPESIRLAQARVVTNGGTFSGSVDVSQWEWTEGEQIKLNTITGLNPNTKYKLTIFIE